MTYTFGRYLPLDSLSAHIEIAEDVDYFKTLDQITNGIKQKYETGM